MSIPAGQERSFRERASYCSKARSITGYKVATKRVSALFVRGTGLDDPPIPWTASPGSPQSVLGHVHDRVSIRRLAARPPRAKAGDRHYTRTVRLT